MIDVSIVIPVYNEEENIQSLYESLHPVLGGLGKSYEVVLVDDGSSDRTMEVLQGIVDQDDAVRVVSLRRNFGQTAAFAAGFDHARGDVIITMDGDNQNDPADIPMMLEKAKDFDLAQGPQGRDAPEEDPLACGQLAHKHGHGCKAPRLWMLPEGIPPRRHKEPRPLWRDAPFYTCRCQLVWDKRYRSAGAPPCKDTRGQVRPWRSRFPGSYPWPLQALWGLLST